MLSELEGTVFKNKSFFGTWKLKSLKNTMDHLGTCKDSHHVKITPYGRLFFTRK